MSQVLCTRGLLRGPGDRHLGKGGNQTGLGEASPKTAMANPFYALKLEWPFRIVPSWVEMVSIYLRQEMQLYQSLCSHHNHTLQIAVCRWYWIFFFFKISILDNTSMELQTLGPLKEH